MGRFNGKHGRGYMRKVREDKRTEAEIRNEAYQEKILEEAKESSSEADHANFLDSALENSATGNVKDLGDFTQFAGRKLRKGEAPKNTVLIQDIYS